jgi:hypothetical protein
MTKPSFHVRTVIAVAVAIADLTSWWGATLQPIV